MYKTNVNIIEYCVMIALNFKGLHIIRNCTSLSTIRNFAKYIVVVVVVVLLFIFLNY